MALEQSYTSSPAGSPQPGAAAGQPSKPEDYWPLEKLKRSYTDYLFAKRDELDEQISARRYYHGSHWTTEQLRILKKRKQPPMTFNRVARKIDGVVGLIEKLRQDPKAYARTPQHEQGADLATAALRYVLDSQEWKAKSPQCASDGAIDGIGGVELELEPGDQGDTEVGFEVVDVASYFYDPASYKDDFSDASYQGMGKWINDDIAKQMFPDAKSGAFDGSGTELTNNSDREMRWFSTVGSRRRIRMVDIWYKHNGGWCWALFTGSAILDQGHSPFKDEKGKASCKYIMFSGNVDQDGDRYGFIRNMKSAQDGLNAKQSKMQHMLASKRIFITRGAVTDIEETRKEAARPDGVVLLDRPVNEGLKVDDQSFDFAGLTKMLELNIQEIENFGPNHALIGQGGVEQNSGRAIALLQQAGMAELGPYILAYKGWKIRVYRAIWNAIQEHWKAQRWVRVTDDQQLAQYIQINGVQMDPHTGQPTLVNAIGSLDVDIILDEGPDHVNAMADVYETLSNVLPAIAPLLAPPQAASIVSLLIETSPMPADVKKKFMDEQQAAQQAAQQQGPPPEVQAAQAKAQIDLQAKQQAAQIEQQKQVQGAQAQRAQLEMNLQAKDQEHNQAMIHAHQQHEMDMAHKQRESDQQLAHEHAKSQIQVKSQSDSADIKKRQMLAIADPAAANELDNLDAFKSITDTFQKGLEDIVSKLEQVIEKPEEKEPPKTIEFKRGKDGKILSAVVTETA